MTWPLVSTGEPRGQGGKQGRAAKGRRAIPPGVAQAVQAEMLAGGSQREVAAKYGVSRDYVRRLSETVKGLDLDHVRTLGKGTPALFTLLTAGAAARALEATERDDPADTTKWTFAAKLAAESQKHIAGQADAAGTTVASFIEALGKAGGGSLSLTVRGTDPEPGDAPIEITAEAIITDPVEDMPDTPG